MSLNVISLKCPECGATLNIEQGRQQAFCTYCGAKIIINNENEYVYRHIDEAAMQQSDNDRAVKMKQMEIEDDENKRDFLMIVFLLGFALIMFLVMLFI